MIKNRERDFDLQSLDSWYHFLRTYHTCFSSHSTHIPTHWYSRHDSHALWHSRHFSHALQACDTIHYGGRKWKSPPPLTSMSRSLLTTVHCDDQRKAGLCLGWRPCTSRRRVQWGSQGTALSAFHLHNVWATIVNLFYNMGHKTIKRYDKINRSGHSKYKSYSLSV